MRFGEIMRTRILGAATVTAVLAVLAAGCGGGDGGANAASPPSDDAAAATTSAAEQDEALVIGNSVPQGSDPTLQLQTQGLEAEAARNGDEVLTVDANLDPSKQIADVDSLIQQGIDVLVIWPLDAEGIRPALDRAREAGIPIITRQTTVGGPYFTNIQEDHVGSGAAAAEYLHEQLGDGAKVAAVVGPEFIQVFREGAEGFLARAKELGLEVVDTQTNDKLTPEVSASIVQTWKQRFGDEIQGIYDGLDNTALGSASQFDDGFHPLLVTQGGSDEGVGAVGDGRVSAVWYIHPALTGRVAGWAAHLAGNGETLPAQLSSEFDVYTEENVAEFVPGAQQVEMQLEFGVEERDGKTYFTVDEA